MEQNAAQVLLPTEAEAYIEILKTFKIKQIGSPAWNQQHEHLEKLNMQAVVSASQQTDEFIKEFIVTHEKITTLIHELLATEIWVQKIFAQFVVMGMEPKVVFPIYMVLYHEATIVNLLETVMYHADVMQVAEDSILDLADYCYRKLTQLVCRVEEEKEADLSDDEDEDLTVQNAGNVSSMKELEKQRKTLNFDICTKTASILRYVSDHLNILPLSVCSRILNTHDVPVLVVQLLETAPWTREKKGVLKKYVDNKWQEMDFGEQFKLTKVEAQLWLTIFQLLMSEECQSKYEFNDYRKNSIIKLKGHLNEMMLDQLPILAELQRYLEQLSFLDPPAPKRELVLEQVPEMRERILAENEGQWDRIAKKQSKIFFSPAHSDIKAQAQRWADTYNLDMMENLLTEPPKCALCGETAVKRCSRCQNEWYCRRECQVNHWKKHKKACDLMEDSKLKT